MVTVSGFNKSPSLRVISVAIFIVIATKTITERLLLALLTRDDRIKSLKGGDRKMNNPEIMRGGAGGRAVLERYGPEFFSQIGKKGGETTVERGQEFYVEIGKKGGETLLARRGIGYFAEIGKKGGELVRDRHGSEFYARIGRKGAKERAAKGRERLGM